MDQLPELIGERVSLRHMTHDDAQGVFEVFGDPNITKWMGIALRRDKAHAKELIDEIDALADEDALYQWGIARDGRIIGTVTLARIDARNKRAELGFALGAAHQGAGYATEAVRLALDYAFGELGLNRIEADTDPRNTASIALLTRVGFEREGYMPQRWLIDEEWCDTVFFGLLASKRR